MFSLHARLPGLMWDLYKTPLAALAASRSHRVLAMCCEPKVVLGVVAAVGAAGAVAFVFLIVVIARQGLQQAGAWAGPLGALAGIVAAVAAVWVLVPRRPEAALPPEPEVALPPQVQVPEWVVDRPAELAAVVGALVGARAGMVGITTGLYGAGGFGKTVLARMACADRQVWQWFEGRVYMVTVGRDVRGAAAIAAKVNDVIKLVTGQDASFTDPQSGRAASGLGTRCRAAAAAGAR